MLIYLFIYLLFLSHDKPDTAELLNCVWGLMREISPENLYLLLHEVYLGDSPVCHPHTHKLMNAARVHPPNTSPPFYPSAPCPSSLLHLPDTPVSSNTIMSRSHFNFCTSQLKSEQRRWRRILFYPPHHRCHHHHSAICKITFQVSPPSSIWTHVYTRHMSEFQSLGEWQHRIN